MEINTKQETERFQIFMQEEGNRNIIFSGKFGVGKSYFLNQFFNERFSEKYLGLFITPVNYSVAGNEDIFEYIKVDILMQLLEKVPCDFSKFEISSNVAAYYYIQNNIFSWIGNILSVAEKVNYGSDILLALMKLKKRIESFRQQYSEDDKKEVFEFFEKMCHKRGSIYESDLITQIIQYLINEAKHSLVEGKVVLVIDDLDRIDPEHIFRILNLLSAHDDFCMSGKHKFDVDQTILVCDIDNIRKIFHARYGSDVDFSGYIDKFYSKEIYRFRNEREIAKIVAEQVNLIVNNGNVKYSDRSSALFESVVYILSSLIRINAINIRTLEKLEFNYSLINIYAYYNGHRYRIMDVPSFMVFELLKRLFGSKDELYDALHRLSEATNLETKRDLEMEYVLSMFVPLADLQSNKFKECDGVLEYKGFRYTLGEFACCGIARLQDFPKPIRYDKTTQIIYDAYLNYDKFVIVGRE